MTSPRYKRGCVSRSILTLEAAPVRLGHNMSGKVAAGRGPALRPVYGKLPVPFGPSVRRRQNIRIGSMDIKIASIAIANDALVLSANLRDFELVPGLRVENWLG